ncbi:DJ-1/PfpI/YhbO family deglycase/protease [Vaginella massiliensis]|uniref:DJ-1/PfpI/YhbO family deglycase/protease n=1 Tax=Vaginella massiliensis TaxID=1816680 RepID=UPI00083837BE|nr:type 1 glutamine amidotransferase domain-containing protein [Vaginella massiliensis]
MNKRVAILTAEGFEEVELTSPKKVLEDAGYKVDIVSPVDDPIKSWAETNWGEEFTVDRNINKEEVKVSDYDALILPGGVLNPDQLRECKRSMQLIKDFMDAKKTIAAICHGPQSLIEAEVIKGKTLTSYKSIQKDLTNAGANWIDKDVVIDGNLITSRTPADLARFNKAILEALK